MGYSPWASKESDLTEGLNVHARKKVKLHAEINKTQKALFNF